MVETSMTTIDEGKKALERLLKLIQEHNLKWNEAETRFQIIDEIITKCLGWPKEAIRLEQPQNRSYSDYEIGVPRKCIWEAKRENRTFELPADPLSKIVVDLPSVTSLGGEVSEAISQVQKYCSERGVEIAVATNGQQLIAFLATRNDGKPPLEGRCIAIRSYDHFINNFPRVWQMLSPSGIAEKRLNRFLNAGTDRALPAKLATLLLNYPRYRYPSDVQNSLRTISELLLIDVIDQPEVERQFYDECYCESGALSQHALITKKMLAARYSALFNPSEPAPNVFPVANSGEKPELTPGILVESYAQRPIILLGDVGVGKTSFLKHLIYVSAFEEFRSALYIYIDLGSRGALAENLRDFVLGELESQLLSKYNIDIYEKSFVTGAHFGSIQRFNRGIYADLKEQNPSLYQKKFIEFLESKTKERDEHIKTSVHHIALGRKKQIIILLDNADQRDYGVQQEAFIISHNFAKDWRAAVFLAVRPETFFRSKQSGALTAYPHQVFTVLPPRVDAVIERRLQFALNMAEGRIPVEQLKDVELRLATIALFLKALLCSLRQNRDLVEFLANITGGNIRSSIDIVTKFIGSPNVNAEKIIEIMSKQNRYIVPVHEFWKNAILGDFSYYDPKSSIALNLFDVYSVNENEHFLLPFVLSYLDIEGPHKSKEGFVETKLIIIEMQDMGFTEKGIEFSLRRATNKKLIETSQRITFDEDETLLLGEMPESFRLTTVGAYHLKRWISEFSYLDAMSIDTPIFNDVVRQEIRINIESFAIQDRLQRATLFREYLTNIWNDLDHRPYYFDWLSSIFIGQESFDRVDLAVRGVQ